MSAPEIVVIGAGAAGIGAGLELARAGVPFLMLEARDRLGGRAHTVEVEGFPLDLGCGWMHRGERNSWRDAFEAAGIAIDTSTPPWGKPALNGDAAEARAFSQASQALESRLAAAAREPGDRPASDLLEPGGRWNARLEQFSAAYNGAVFEQVSVKDYARFDEGRSNVRAPGGYGAGIVRLGRDLPVRFGATVVRIDHSGPRVRVELADGGVMEARAAIVTLPTALLARGEPAFDPPLRDKAAAANVPLGFAAKAYLHWGGIEAEAAPDSFVHGRSDTLRTLSFHVRPFGRPIAEGYLGGDTARDLEHAGPRAMADFAIEELAHAMGSGVRARVRVLATTDWSVDPRSRGAYSHALPGCADDRAKLAAPVDGRLFFAGEHCSRDSFSTAHGAKDTGVAAAKAALASFGASFETPPEGGSSG